MLSDAYQSAIDRQQLTVLGLSVLSAVFDCRPLRQNHCVSIAQSLSGKCDSLSLSLSLCVCVCVCVSLS